MRLIRLVITIGILATTVGCGDAGGNQTASPHSGELSPTRQRTASSAEATTSTTATGEAQAAVTSETIVDPLALCFDETALPDTTQLPGSFGDDTGGDGIEITNELAASSALNPIAFEQQLAGWGRLTGIYRSWAFLTDTEPPTKQESLSLPTATLEAWATQEEFERRSTPIAAVGCGIEVYLTAEGAEQAFPYQVEVQARTKLLAPGYALTLESFPVDGLPDDALSVLVRGEDQGYPHLRSYQGSIRIANVIGQVSVHGAWCDIPDGLSCEDIDATLTDEGQRLLQVLHDRIAERARSAGQMDMLPEATAVPTPAASREGLSINPEVPESLYYMLPSLYQARLSSGLALTEARLREGNSQLFEHTSTDALTLGFAGLYQGADTTLTIDLALFETGSGAVAGFHGIEIDDLAGRYNDVDTIDMGDIGAEAKGWVFQPDPKAEEWMIIAVAQVDQLVVGVSATGQHRTELAEAVRAVVELEADAIGVREMTSQPESR